MTDRRDIIHQLLDGGLPPDEKQAIRSLIEHDAVLRKEFDDLTSAVGLMGKVGRKA